MAKPFLILQLRPEDEAADDELAAFLKFGGLKASEVQRVRIEKESIPEVNLEDYAGVIVGGGPSNVSDLPDRQSTAQRRFERELVPLLDDVIDRDFPFLGACYGLGILAKHLGGTVSKERYSEEVGAVTIKLADDGLKDPLTAELPAEFRAFAGHKEACQDVPPGATLLAGSDSCPVQMIRVKQNVYGTQFHTELDKTGLALRINIYKDAGYFPPEDVEKLIEASKDEVVDVPEQILCRFVEQARQQAA